VARRTVLITCLLAVTHSVLVSDCGAGPSLTPADPGAGAARAQAREVLHRLPIAFEENQGQTDARVKFLARGPHYTLFLTSTEAMLSLPPERSRERSAPDAPADVVRRLDKEPASRARPLPVDFGETE